MILPDSHRFARETDMLEIEVKYRVDDFAKILEELQIWGAKLIEERDDADTYFNAPHRDFARTDEAFRVRRIGERTFVTYKGPRKDEQTKTRTEIEVPLSDGADDAADFERLLAALGFRATATVHKHRRVFGIDRAGYHVEICLDEADRIGSYVELEIIATEAELDRARDVVLQLAAELGLVAMERRSYLELLLQAP
jgi:adenylate cyclase class 2